jgi:hypothetical protein
MNGFAARSATVSHCNKLTFSKTYVETIPLLFKLVPLLLQYKRISLLEFDPERKYLTHRTRNYLLAISCTINNRNSKVKFELHEKSSGNKSDRADSESGRGAGLL